MNSTMERRLTWAVFFAAAGGVAWVCLQILRPFASVIAWSAVLALVCYPVHERLTRWTNRVALSAFITSLLSVLALFVPLLLVGTVAVREGVVLADSVRSLAGRAGVDWVAVSAWLEQHGAQVVESAGRYTASFASGIVDAIASSFLIVFALFLILRDAPRIVAGIAAFLPFERQRAEALLRRVNDVVQASVYGVVVIALAQGALCGVMFALLGIPAPALWGIVTVFASLLPVVGAFAVWGPGTVFLAMNGHWPQAIALAVWGTFVVSGIDNILRPRLVAGRTGLSELAMFFALLGGLTVFGPLGVVLGPVAFATLGAVVDILRDPALDDGVPRAV